MVEVENGGELVKDEDKGEVENSECEKMDGTKEVNCELIEERIWEVFQIEEDARGEINCGET